MVLRTYKYRLYPTKKQSKILDSWLETCRVLYNDSLAERKENYEQKGLSLGYAQQNKQLTTLKKTDESLQAVHSQVLQDVLRRLQKAFDNFFRRVKLGEQAGYPRFKGWKRYKSFTYPQSGFKVVDNKFLQLSKIGKVNIKLHRDIPQEGPIKTCSIKKDGEQWYATFTVEFSRELPPPLTQVETAVGLDVGLEKLATLSTGDKIANPRWLQETEKQLAREQRNLSRKKKGSKNRAKQKQKVARLHRKVRHQRQDFHHKLSRGLVAQYDLLVFEDLRIKNMVRNHPLAKSISDASWGQLLLFTLYKAAEAGTRVETVNPNGTSQECSSCGQTVKKSLAARVHVCPHCGLILDRDHNAALNILKRGLEQMSLTTKLSTIFSTLGTSGRAWQSHSTGKAVKQEATQCIGW